METATQDSTELEIKGFKYIVNHNGPEVAWDIGIEISKLIGEPVSSMAIAGEDPNSAALALSGAVKAFLSKLDSKSSFGLIKKILATVECQGPSEGPTKKFMLDGSGINSHFRGRTGAMFTLASEVIAFTHADFFEAIGDGIAAMMKKAMSKE